MPISNIDSPLVNYTVDNIRMLLHEIPPREEILVILQNNLDFYLVDIQKNGFGIKQIDDLALVILILRMTLLSIRYNPITGAVITAISVIAGYLWYNSFVETIMIYEESLYLNMYSYRLGVDATNFEKIIEMEDFAPDSTLKVTNPVGLLAYAINNATLHEGYRIDPISMVMSRLPQGLIGYKQYIRIYYLVYRDLLTMAIRAFMEFSDMFNSYVIYVYMTRVNKKYCPYLIRWHWTFLMITKFADNYIFHFNYRLLGYTQTVLAADLAKARALNFALPLKVFEIRMVENIAFALIGFHLGFLLFGLYHALAGQYFYIPFFTENVELHIGPRDINNIYSGGLTAWQDPAEKPKYKLGIPKLWFGFFGRGTKKDNAITFIIKLLIFNPIKKFLKKIRRLFRVKE